MHGLAVPEIDRDVVDALAGEAVEQQIAGLGAVETDTAANVALLARTARQRDTRLAEHVLHQAAAVEALRRGAAVAVRAADLAQRIEGDTALWGAVIDRIGAAD